MTAKPAVGGYVYRQSVARGRNATETARAALRRIVEEQPGPQTTALLIAQTALSIGEVERVLNELDEIGRNASKTNRTLKVE